MAWQQDTTVVDSALQEAIVDTIFVAVGGGWATAATIIAAIVAAAATVTIARFTWVTHRRDTEDRKERTRATDTRVSVRADFIRGRLNAWTTTFTSGDKAFDWAKQFVKSSKPILTDIRSLVEESPGASAPVSEVIRHAYVNFMAAIDQITRATRESDPSIKTDLSKQAHVYLEKCVDHLSQAVDDGLKSAAAGVAHALRGSLTASAKVTARLTTDSTEEDAPNQAAHLDD